METLPSEAPQTTQSINIRRAFLMTFLGSLGISALVAIFVFLLGSFGDTEFRLLATTLTIGGYSITGLCSSMLYDKKKYVPLAYAGFAVSVVGFLTTVGAIWELIDLSDVWRAILVFIILAFSLAHASLLLLARSTKPSVNGVVAATLFFIALVAFMVIHVVLNTGDLGEFYFRLLGVFAVLDILGTITTPLLKKFNG